jgi:aminopeptidase N
MCINIEVPRKYEAICNGSLRRVVSANKKYDRYEWFVHYPINNYNVTFYMGKYVEFTDTLLWQSDTLVLRYHVLPYHLEKAKEHFRQARDVVAFYNDAFGQFPFPKDNFCMVESPFEGMEHQTAIAYGASFDNWKNSITYLSKKFDYIIVHEAAHEWWGNSVAVGDMADIWIHEGFATYSEFLFLEHRLGYEESIAEMHNHMNYINNIWPLVQNRNVNEDAFAGNDVYYKGAILLQCLRATIDNDTLFKNMLRDFHLQYLFKVVDSQDFIDFVNNYTEHNFTPLFKIFLYDARLPILEYKYERIGDDLLLQYKWTGVNEGFEMPFSIETIGEKKAYRIIANTAGQDTLIENASSFTFYNLHKSPEGCPHNGMTYYWTKCIDVEKQE